MDTRSTITTSCPVPNLAHRFDVALSQRPDWAKSFTVTPLSGNLIRITYANSLSFGVTLDEAMAYISRHVATSLS